jgi:hypothetical protein
MAWMSLTPHLTGKSRKMPSVLTAVTVSDLLHQPGGILPERVRLQPPPGTATEVDVVAVHNREDRLCELVDHVLVEKTLGYYESSIAATGLIPERQAPFGASPFLFDSALRETGWLI